MGGSRLRDGFFMPRSKEAEQQRYLKNRDHMLALRHARYLRQSSLVKEQTQKWRKANKDRYLANMEVYNKRNHEAFLAHHRQRWAAFRAKLFDAFGGCCAKCGYSDHRALQLDHIKGGGTKEYRALGKGVYHRALAHPEDYQILCANCNLIKATENRERFKTPLAVTKAEYQLPFEYAADLHPPLIS